jgi:hypothetical protein
MTIPITPVIFTPKTRRYQAVKELSDLIRRIPTVDGQDLSDIVNQLDDGEDWYDYTGEGAPILTYLMAAGTLLGESAFDLMQSVHRELGW